MRGEILMALSWIAAMTCLHSCGVIHSVPEVSTESVEETDQQRFAEAISHKLLTTQQEGSFYPLSANEATPRMAEGLNEQLQKLSHIQIKAAFGDYQGLSFHEMVLLDENPGFQIYRFKGDFSSGREVEVRTVLDQNGKLAGFFVKPWQQKL